MSSPNEYQIPTQPPIEADVSLRASRLQSVEAATKLNGARSEVQDIYSQREPEVRALEESSRIAIGQVSVYMTAVRRETSKDET